jgi:hypothetical protein
MMRVMSAFSLLVVSLAAFLSAEAIHLRVGTTVVKPGDDDSSGREDAWPTNNGNSNKPTNDDGDEETSSNNDGDEEKATYNNNGEEASTRAASTFPLFINSGAGSPYTDSSGRTWVPDEQFLGVSGTTAPNRCPLSIAYHSIDEVLYCTERLFNPGENGIGGYNIPVAPGSYRVVLHFAEIYHPSKNERTFDIEIEQDLVENNFDIVEEAGAPFTATSITYIANVRDNFLHIEFEDEIGRPKISAVEVHEA